MAKVSVYSFTVYDHQQGQTTTRPIKGTIEAVDRSNGVIVPGTEELIDETLLDGAGYYRPSD